MLRLILIALLATMPAAAQTNPAIYVDPQEDRKEEIACNLSYEQSIAALQAGIRHNNMQVTYKADAKALNVFFTLITVEVTPGAACATSYSMSLYEPRMIFSSVTNATHNAAVEYCFKSGVVSGRISDLQERLNGMIKSSLDACISDFGRYTIR